MFNAQYLHHENAVYSPWMTRQGDYIRVTAELIAFSNAKLKVQVWTKNNETPGDGADADTGTDLTITTLTTATAEWGQYDIASPPPLGLLELVRYKMTCVTLTTTDPSDYVLFRMLEPVWFDAVKV